MIGFNMPLRSTVSEISPSRTARPFCSQGDAVPNIGETALTDIPSKIISSVPIQEFNVCTPLFAGEWARGGAGDGGPAVLRCGASAALRDGAVDAVPLCDVIMA